jgi:hypothetical protein
MPYDYASETRQYLTTAFNIIEPVSEKYIQQPGVHLIYRNQSIMHTHQRIRKTCLAFWLENYMTCIKIVSEKSRILLTYVIWEDNLRKGYLCRAGGCSSIVAFDRICLRARRGCCSAAARSFAVGFS